MHIYNEFLLPFWQTYKTVFVFDFIRYAVGAGGVYLVLNLILSRWINRLKIRPTKPPLRQIGRELILSFRTILIFAGVGSIIGLGVGTDWFQIYLDINEYGIWWLVLSTVTLIVAHDAWFYWAHKIIHHPRLFRRFHRAHHLSHNPTPFTAYSFDIGEAVINAIYLPIILLVLPSHPIALFIFTGHMMLRNALGHSGYEVFPANRHGKPLLGFLTTVTHHDMHHAHAGYNLGLYFTWWDRIMGTEHPDYLTQYAAKAPSIKTNIFTNPTMQTLLLCYGIATVTAAAAACA
ncbi:MAG: sterol desaturase family protein [Pikeienuella sp.]